MDCKNCDVLKKKESEIETLKRTQDLLILLIDLGLYAVEEWAKENGLLGERGENLYQHISKGSDQIGVLLKQVGKSGEKPTLDRLIGLLKLL